MVSSVGKGIQQSTGRVIALGRLMLATLFPLAIWTDASQPAQYPAVAYAVLFAYVLFAAAITALTWNSWWRDARLAGPSHAVDIILFAVLVLLTEGYTSPFFTFFMFVLLSAAIRWGWRATALSATLLALLYVLTGLVGVISGVPFEPQRFMIRTGHLIILSLILIWFGSNQRWTRFGRDEQFLENPSLDETPLDAGLRAAMRRAKASAGTFVWRYPDRDDYSGISIDGERVSQVDVPASLVTAHEAAPFLYDFRDRHAMRREDRNLVAFDPSALFLLRAQLALRLTEGLAIPLRSDDGQGLLFLEKVRGLSVDHIDLGDQIGADVNSHRQRHALVRAAQESAEAKSRLILARDLHDSVVQFLAGASFRLEAAKRSNSSGEDVGPQLDELKHLMMQEQKELRSFITSLRSGPLAAFNDLVRDLEALSVRLSKQWDIACEFKCKPVKLMIPTRIRLDAQQMMREAVANAVRHASAKSVAVELIAAPDALNLQVVNDGADFPLRNGRIEIPASLKERVEQAGGTLDVSRGMGVTRVSISLPIGEVGR